MRGGIGLSVTGFSTTLGESGEAGHLKSEKGERVYVHCYSPPNSTQSHCARSDSSISLSDSHLPL